jgi:hypothetical protein
MFYEASYVLIEVCTRLKMLIMDQLQYMLIFGESMINLPRSVGRSFLFLFFASLSVNSFALILKRQYNYSKNCDMIHDSYKLLEE